MNSKTIVFMRKTDVFILAFLLILSLLFLLIPFREKGSIAQIILNQEVIAEVSLGKSQKSFSIEGAPGYLFSVENGTIAVSSAPCGNQDCVHTGAIGKAGQRIVCLPGRLMVAVVSENQKQDTQTPDAIL